MLFGSSNDLLREFHLERFRSEPNKVSVIFKKKDKEDTSGYLRLSYRQYNKTKLISIKMLPAIPENYWNAKKERIKSGFNNYQELNQIIEKSKLDFSRIYRSLKP